MRRWKLAIDYTGSVEGIYAFIYCTKWRPGRVSRMPHWLTHSQMKDRATQLLIKYKSGALVTQFNVPKSSRIQGFARFTVEQMKAFQSRLCGSIITTLLLEVLSRKGLGWCDPADKTWISSSRRRVTRNFFVSLNVYCLTGVYNHRPELNMVFPLLDIFGKGVS